MVRTGMKSQKGKKAVKAATGIQQITGADQVQKQRRVTLRVRQNRVFVTDRPSIAAAVPGESLTTSKHHTDWDIYPNGVSGSVVDGVDANMVARSSRSSSSSISCSRSSRSSTSTSTSTSSPQRDHMQRRLSKAATMTTSTADKGNDILNSGEPGDCADSQTHEQVPFSPREAEVGDGDGKDGEGGVDERPAPAALVLCVICDAAFSEDANSPLSGTCPGRRHSWAVPSTCSMCGPTDAFKQCEECRCCGAAKCRHWVAQNAITGGHATSDVVHCSCLQHLQAWPSGWSIGKGQVQRQQQAAQYRAVAEKVDEDDEWGPARHRHQHHHHRQQQEQQQLRVQALGRMIEEADAELHAQGRELAWSLQAQEQQRESFDELECEITCVYEQLDTRTAQLTKAHTQLRRLREGYHSAALAMVVALNLDRDTAATDTDVVSWYGGSAAPAASATPTTTAHSASASASASAIAREYASASPVSVAAMEHPQAHHHSHLLATHSTTAITAHARQHAVSQPLFPSEKDWLGIVHGQGHYDESCVDVEDTPQSLK